MNVHQKNFNSWFKDTLKSLYPNREAGFVILMVAFPLLERYLRKKSGVRENSPLDKRFYAEFCYLFPEFKTEANAKNCWDVYRNGLLHQVTFSRRTRKGISLPEGLVSHDVDMLSMDEHGNFCVHPVEFAERVIKAIEDDFATFEGRQGVHHPLPTVKRTPPLFFPSTSATD